MLSFRLFSPFHDKIIDIDRQRFPLVTAQAGVNNQYRSLNSVVKQDVLPGMLKVLSIQ
jgi:hypothetical protein